MTSNDYNEGARLNGYSPPYTFDHYNESTRTAYGTAQNGLGVIGPIQFKWPLHNPGPSYFRHLCMFGPQYADRRARSQE